MKKLIIIFLLPLVSFSQHFKVENNIVLWQKVYTDSTNLQSIKNYLITHSDSFKEVKENNDKLLFLKEFESLQLKPYGYKAMSFPTYMGNNGSFSGYIEFKDGKYRVTINNLMVKTIRIVALEVTDQYDEDNISTYILDENGNINYSKSNTKALKVFDTYFTQLFTIKEKEDW